MKKNMGQRGGWPYIDPAHARKCFRFDKKNSFFVHKKKKGVEPSREKICKKYFDETRTSTLLFLKIDK